MKYVALYIFSVVLVNYGFSSFSGYEWFWSIVVGTVFITRDYCQRAVGHWCIAAMVVAGVLSYFMADPYVAIASVSAFAVAELVDWIVYSLTKRPLADRILVSSAIATPLDTVVFLSMLGLLTPSLIGFQVASKMLEAVAIWSMLRFMVKKS